jgi:hypothetical protein
MCTGGGVPNRICKHGRGEGGFVSQVLGSCLIRHHPESPEFGLSIHLIHHACDHNSIPKFAHPRLNALSGQDGRGCLVVVFLLIFFFYVIIIAIFFEKVFLNLASLPLRWAGSILVSVCRQLVVEEVHRLRWQPSHDGAEMTWCRGLSAICNECE